MVNAPRTKNLIFICIYQKVFVILQRKIGTNQPKNIVSMKKISLFSSLALVALWLAPQTMLADDCTFIPNLFPGQATDRTATEVSATVHVGEWGPESYDPSHLINSLASSNENAVKVSSNGGYNAAVYFAAVGTADVTYTETIQRSSCTGVDQTIHYTVAKGIPSIYFAGADGSAVSEYTAAYSTSGGGDAAGGADGGEGGGSYVWTPSYYARYMVLNESRGYRFVNTAIPVGELTFNSTNPAVASISESGVTTVNGLGTTVISVSWPGNANWEAGQGSYTLKVKKQANIYFNPSLIKDTVEKVIKPNVVCPEGVTISSWRSSNTNIATVDNEGNVTLLKAGTVNIYATSAENEEYASGLCACQITIAKKVPVIYFSPDDVEIELSAAGSYVHPALIKPADLDVNLYKWRLSKEDIATINTNTGEMTIYGTGKVRVYFYSEATTDPKYEPSSAAYYLTVTNGSGVTVAGINVSAENPDPLGDGSVVYSVDPNMGKILTLNNLNFVGDGITTFIEADKLLNILVNGNCSISNVPYAINTSSGVFIWCQNNKDTITIDAQYTAINAGSVKVHDCYLFANAGLYAISTQAAISVSAGGYIFANATGQNIGGKGTPEAIRADFFVKGEDGIGGIEVLTKGVTFHDAGEGGAAGTGGFFTNYAAGNRATFVEIGKVPLPLPDDEVTDIDFETEDPHNNLNVVFSESKNDAYNEVSKQIEITTITADGQVTTASAYVTCSSEWLKLLPGVLVFDVPQGSGEIAVQYELAEGFTLKATIEGVGEASISWANPGWAKIQYNVTQQTHVIIYLQTASSASAPAKAPAKTSTLASGAAIKAIKITPSGTTTSIESIQDNASSTTDKMLLNGQIFILRGEKIYTVTGQEVK